MWIVLVTPVIIVCSLPYRASMARVAKGLSGGGPTISERILPILAVGFEGARRHSRTVMAASLSTMSLIDAGGPGSGDHPVIGAIRTNWGKHHGAVRPPSCLAWLGTEAEIGQDRRSARPRWPCRPQRASVLRLRPAGPCRRPALGRTWPSEPLALCLCRAGRPYMVMGGPPGRAAASGRGDGLTAPPLAPACASSRPRR